MTISCLEVLMVLLKETNTFSQSNRSVKTCVAKICELASEHY